MGTNSGGINNNPPADLMITDHDDRFPSLPSESFTVQAKKQKTNSLKRPAETPISQASPASSQLSSSATDPHPSSVCIITREDHKALPFNFYNNATPRWPVLGCLLPNTLERNQKGTVIRGQIKPDKVAAFTLAPKSFVHNNIKYSARVPQTPSAFVGEIIFDFHDIDDKSLLSVDESHLKALLTVSPASSHNSILSVHKLYPRKVITNEDPLFKTITQMRISIECSSAIPERVYYESVSLRVLPYVQPPTRCFICQRYGHGAVSCRRKARCAKCSSLGHLTSECKSDTLHCFACQAPHACSSIRCKFYKAALAISAQVQSGRLARTEAYIMYASLYKNPERLPSNQPIVTPSPASSQTSFSLPKTPLPSKNAPSSSPPPLTVSTNPSSSSSLLSSYSHPLTQAQKPSKKTPVRPTPPHLTQEYADVLKGNLWYTSQGMCLPPDSNEFYSSTSSAPSSVSQSDPSTGHAQKAPETSILTLIQSLLKPLLQRVVDWIISCLPSDSPIASIFSTLLQSLSASISSLS